MFSTYNILLLLPSSRSPLFTAKVAAEAAHLCYTQVTFLSLFISLAIALYNGFWNRQRHQNEKYFYLEGPGFHPRKQQRKEEDPTNIVPPLVCSIKCSESDIEKILRQTSMPANPSEFLLDEEQPFHHASPSSAPILDDVQELSENEENDEQNCKLDITSEPIKIKSARAREAMDDDDLREVKEIFCSVYF